MKDTLKKKYFKIIKNPNIGSNLVKNFLNKKNNQNHEEINYYLAKRAFETFNLALNEFFKKKINTEDKLIDLGCGTESFVKLVKEKNIKVKGYDLDTVDLENSKIPESNDSADYVTCLSIIEHLKDPSNLLSEIYRILKPNGILIIVTPNFYYCYRNFYDDPTHFNPFTPKKLETILKLFGFKSNYVLPWIVKKNPKIWRLPMKFFFARYCLLARGDTKLPIPEFFKGKSSTILSLSEKKI